MNPTLCHHLFRTLLESKVLSTEGYVSTQVEEHIEMLLDEYCGASNRAA